jgi:hypothetical protein
MDREERRWLRHGIRSVLLGVLLIAFFAVASFALGPGELPESRLGLAVGVTLCPMGLLLWWLSRPTTVFWPIVLRVFACAVLAVTSFWRKRPAEPILIGPRRYRPLGDLGSIRQNRAAGGKPSQPLAWVGSTGPTCGVCSR